MNLIIQGSKNFTVSEKIKAYIKKRTEKLNYFKNHIQEINFHLDAEKFTFKVDVTLSLKKLGVQKFQTTATEMYSAIDKIVHKMDVKINREKTKIQSHAKPGHEEFVEFFNQHDEKNPEPTESISINPRPSLLQDSYLQMKEEKKDFFGFTLLDAEKNSAPAFLRILDDDILYLFKKNDDTSYVEYSLSVKDNDVKIDKEIRTIKLAKLNLFEAQKDILEEEYPFDLFVDSASSKISFLFKESNGKWIILS